MSSGLADYPATTTVVQLSSNNAEGTEAALTTWASPATTAMPTHPTVSATPGSHTAYGGSPGSEDRGNIAAGASSSANASPTDATPRWTCWMWVFAVIFLVYTLFIVLTILLHPIPSITKHKPLLGLVLAVLFLAPTAAAGFCWLKILFVPAGPLQPYMAASKVEECVAAALHDVCVQELGEDFMATYGANHPHGKARGAVSPPSTAPAAAVVDEDEDDKVAVNAVMAASMAAYLPPAPAAHSTSGALREAAKSSSSSDDDDDDGSNDSEHSGGVDERARRGVGQSQLPQESEAVRRARREKRRREREERRAAQRAKKLLQGDDADPEAARERERKAMARRRRRRARHGIESFTLGDAALRAYLRLRSDDKAAREQVVSSLLVSGESNSVCCDHCGVYRIQSIAHCMLCNRCSVGQDMHCVLLGACIGRDNHKYVVLFEFYCFLAALMAVIISLYAVGSGYDFFFTYEESHTAFYVAFCMSASTAMVLLPLLLQQLFSSIGRGETTMRAVMREQESQLAMARREEDGGVYRPMATSEPLPQPGKFRWSNLRNVFGDDERVWTWFLPTMAPLRPRREDEERKFQQECAEAVAKTLRAVADSSREYEESVLRERRHQDVGVSIQVEDEQDGATDSNDRVAAELVSRYTNPNYASSSLTVADGGGGGVVSPLAVEDAAPAAPTRAGAGAGAGAAEQEGNDRQHSRFRADILSTADHPATPPMRPTIQRVPFFAKRSVASPTPHTDPTSATTHTTAAAAAAGPTFRTIDPFELYNQPAVAPTVRPPTATTATASSFSVPHGSSISAEGPPAAATQQQQPPSPLAHGSATDPAALAAPSGPRKAANHRAKMD